MIDRPDLCPELVDLSDEFKRITMFSHLFLEYTNRNAIPALQALEGYDINKAQVIITVNGIQMSKVDCETFFNRMYDNLKSQMDELRLPYAKLVENKAREIINDKFGILTSAIDELQGEVDTLIKQAVEAD
jgi:hypothetical protein